MKKKWGHSILFFFALVPYNTERPWAALSSDLEDCYCGNNDFLFVYMETVRDQLDVCESMRPGGVHPRVLKELVVVAA